MKTRKNKERLINRIIFVILSLLLLYSMLHNVFEAVGITPTFFGLSSHVVDNSVMRPALRSGDLAVFVRSKDIKVDDIVIYGQGDFTKIRRVLSVNTNNNITSLAIRGDNTHFLEGINQDEVRGKMIFRVPIAGRVVGAIQTKTFMIISLIYIVVLYRYKKKKRERQEKRQRRFEEKEQQKRSGY